MKVLSDLAIDQAKNNVQIALTLYGNLFIISCHYFRGNKEIILL